MRTTLIFLLVVVCTSIAQAQEPIFQWQKTGPFGGDITSVAGNDSFLLAGTGTAQIQRSTNQGAAWNLSSGGLASSFQNAVRCIVMNSQSQIASVGSNYGEGINRGEILYRSINQGQIWTRVTFATVD